MVTHPHIVQSYDHDLQLLKKAVADMGLLGHKQFQKTLLSLSQKNSTLASEVIETDADIDELDVLINKKALRILALRQPVAFDLRLVIAALKMSNHLERIGDYAANISRRILSLNEATVLPLETPALVFQMGETVHKMLEDILDSFSLQDLILLEKAWLKDLEVDSLYASLLRELLTYMMEDPRRITGCTHLLFIAKNIERVGDHATSLAEIIYMMIQGHPLDKRKPFS